MLPVCRVRGGEVDRCEAKRGTAALTMAKKRKAKKAKRKTTKRKAKKSRR